MEARASSEQGSPGQLVALAAGFVFNPIVLYSDFVLKTTGKGLPPGPGGGNSAIAFLCTPKRASPEPLRPTGGIYGAAEGVGFLVRILCSLLFAHTASRLRITLTGGLRHSGLELGNKGPDWVRVASRRAFSIVRRLRYTSRDNVDLLSSTLLSKDENL